MLESLFSSTTVQVTEVTPVNFLICTLASVVLGLVIALASTYRNRVSQSFVITLALLPTIVQSVILLVNGNLGTGLAVAGAFSLVRFRSVPGSGREICFIFFAMAVGLSTGTGFLWVAVLLTLLLCGLSLLYTRAGVGNSRRAYKELKIVIPESLDYSGLFDDLLQQYTESFELTRVKTTNMGSMYKLYYRVVLKDGSKEKEMLDAMRCRNGNLEISCGRLEKGEEL
jgi:hypothetical protein